MGREPASMDGSLIRAAEELLEKFRTRQLKLAAAESCTGGLIAACLTEIAGSSDVVERGFVTYSNEAKTEMLGVSADLIAQHGAVSEQVARAMVAGALVSSRADIAVAVTGVAGPTGGTPGKPVGLVHLAAGRRNGEVMHLACTFGDIGRARVRAETVAEAFRLLETLL